MHRISVPPSTARREQLFEVARAALAALACQPGDSVLLPEQSYDGRDQDAYRSAASSLAIELGC